MPCVEVKDIGGLAVEDKSDRELVLEHLARDVISVTELITEAVTLRVKEKATLTTESCKEP